MNRRKLNEKLVPLVTGLSAGLIMAVVMIIMGNIIWGGWQSISWEFLTGVPTDGMTGGGIFPAIVGTLLLVVIMSLIGVPIGTITAVYLCEYVSQGSRLVRLIRFAVNTLAGIPAIVFGLFGLGFFIEFVGRGADHWLMPNGVIR